MKQLNPKACPTLKSEINVSFVEDSNGGITDEICFELKGYTEDFELGHVSTILNLIDIKNLIELLQHAKLTMILNNG